VARRGPCRAQTGARRPRTTNWRRGCCRGAATPTTSWR
jgi:hypothetical protein